ncbi:MAG: radical SAM protein, partial [Fibrobacteres bacterium]|nr:radical SAM protein [Fibrobacterota bacterium]
MSDALRTKTFSSIVGKLHRNTKIQTISTATIELSHLCNFSCPHCYIRTSEKCDSELTIKEFIQISKELQKLNCVNVVLTGGEPLLHPLFDKIYRIFKRAGFFVTVMTNGYLLNKFLKLFIELPPKSIEISLYGITQIVFSTVTNKQYDYRTVLNNIVEANKHNMRLKLKAVLLKNNTTEISKYKEFAKS